VDKSQRRVSRKTALSSGHQLKRFATLTPTVSATGYIAFKPANLWPRDLVGKKWCEQ